jgi:hypothetical protein
VNARYHIQSLRPRYNHLHLDAGLPLTASISCRSLFFDVREVVVPTFRALVRKILPLRVWGDQERATSSDTCTLGLGTASDGCCYASPSVNVLVGELPGLRLNIIGERDADGLPSVEA